MVIEIPQSIPFTFRRSTTTPHFIYTFLLTTKKKTEINLLTTNKQTKWQKAISPKCNQKRLHIKKNHKIRMRKRIKKRNPNTRLKHSNEAKPQMASFPDNVVVVRNT